MSEEILKALMQLFAIITKQDEGASEKERKYVALFLKMQLNAEMVPSYLALYDDYLGVTSKETGDDETRRKRLTSVKDSVRTLSICKKINKTLTQKQKIIVLIRLFELVSSENADAGNNNQRMEIINTVATVFNVETAEYESIEKFCQASNLETLNGMPGVLLVGHNIPFVENGAKIIDYELEGVLGILHVPSEDMFFLKFTGKSNVLLNGLPVNANQIYLFAYGSTLKLPIGDPLYYSDVNSYFLEGDDIQKISFTVSRLEYQFANGKVGLRDINFSEGSGKLIAIMGGSGAGKTTLLNVLAGLESPSEGEVKINGIDIHRERKKAEGVIGYVAQDDILFEELSVYQNLFYNAKLCFKDLSDQQLEELVLKTLKNLGLGEIKDLKVGNVLNKKISGGQRKRLNIALELIREPAVLFLDEPTSGLSSRDSENVMDLLKELTLKGKLIFVVIHQPSSDIYKMFDHVMILDVGGYMIYYGNPVNAVTYFKKITNQINADEGQCATCGNVNPEQIFNTIEAKVVDEYGNLTETRKIPPKIWNDYFKENIKEEHTETVVEAPPKTLSLPSKVTQYAVFTLRDFLSKASNIQYLLINLLEAPVLALILAFIIRYIDDPLSDHYYYGQNENIPAYIFMSIIVALFMGLTVSAEEIIRDAKILKRESFLNLSRTSYLLSKVSILFLISAIQTLLFVLIGNTILGIKDMGFSYWIMLFSLSCTANMLGLNISATFNSAVTIYILIPIMLIPQMILSGAIFSFDKLNRAISSKDKVPVVADFMASRWAFEALAVRQFKDNKFERSFYEMEKMESLADFKSVYWGPHVLKLLDEAENLAGKKTQKELIRLSQIKVILTHEFAFILGQINGLAILPEDVKSSLEKFDSRSLDYLKTIARMIQDYFSEEYSKHNARKDQIFAKFMSTPENQEVFNEMKRHHYNESLADLVRNTSAKKRLIEYEDRLIQVIDPVFMEPERVNSVFTYRAHLYAPGKWFLGKYFDTFWFNMAFIWFMTFLLYLTLYTEVFKKIITFIARVKLFKQNHK